MFSARLDASSTGTFTAGPRILGTSSEYRVVTPRTRSSFDSAEKKLPMRDGSTAPLRKADRPSMNSRFTLRRWTASIMVWP